MADSDTADGQDTCGFPTNAGGPCQNRATGDDGRCWIETHDDSPDAPEAVTDGRGAPEGNQHAKGNSGGAAPEGNTNAKKHGLHQSVKRRLETMTDEQRDLFEDYYVEYAGKAENDSQAARLASLAVIADDLETHLITDGVFFEKEIDDKGTTVEVPKGQTLEAFASALRELRLGQKYEGVSGNNSGGGSSAHEGASELWE